MDCSRSKSTLKKDVAHFVQWMKSELQNKATWKSEVYNFNFQLDVSQKKTCKRLSWVIASHNEDSLLHNTLPKIELLNS